MRVSGRSRRLHGRGTAAVTHGTRIRALSTLARPQRGERPRVSVSSDSSAVDIQAITFIYKYVSPNCGTSISLPMMRYSSVYVCVRACERHLCSRRRVASRGTRFRAPCRPETGSTNLVDVHTRELDDRGNGERPTSTVDHGVALPLDARLAAPEVTRDYTCSLYHIVLHCLLTDNTATSHCRLDGLANEFFVQLSSNGARSFTQ